MFYDAEDGTRVPMFMTSKRIELDGHNPTMLYAYGGFDISQTPHSPIRHPRVAGEASTRRQLSRRRQYGEAWHLAGTNEKKQNVFDDFIAAADS